MSLLMAVLIVLGLLIAGAGLLAVGCVIGGATKIQDGREAEADRWR